MITNWRRQSSGLKLNSQDKPTFTRSAERPRLRPDLKLEAARREAA